MELEDSKWPDTQAAIEASKEEAAKRQMTEETTPPREKAEVEKDIAESFQPQRFHLTDVEPTSSLENSLSSTGHGSRFGLSTEHRLAAEAATPRRSKRDDEAEAEAQSA
eukprot:1483296-Karenia_brevis.AAC.1